MANRERDERAETISEECERFMMALCRYLTNSAGERMEQWGWVAGEQVYPLETQTVIEMCSNPPTQGLTALGAEAMQKPSGVPLDSVALLAPVLPMQEVWAAGVTYESSKFARMSESEHGGDLYAKVYTADRPELFFKATPSRVIGPNAALRIRADSHWNVPEPELTALIAANGQILGYTVGNDMSSRDIEGENALYLPQAKVYRACCGLGPVVVPTAGVDAENLSIRLTIHRETEIVFEGETSTARMRRTAAEIAQWLFRENDFPYGVFLLTGTGIVPPDSFTLLSGDEIAIEIESLGTLRNTVE
jgi:2-dehydro-3-deoxy-D-arabinonate dehydratase